jgi:hypothetical protein
MIQKFPKIQKFQNFLHQKLMRHILLLLKQKPF